MDTNRLNNEREAGKLASLWFPWQQDYGRLIWIDLTKPFPVSVRICLKGRSTLSDPRTSEPAFRSTALTFGHHRVLAADATLSSCPTHRLCFQVVPRPEVVKKRILILSLVELTYLCAASHLAFFQKPLQQSLFQGEWLSLQLSNNIVITSNEYLDNRYSNNEVIGDNNLVTTTH